MGTALFGLCICAISGWNLWTGLQPDGEFLTRWPFPPADRDHPILFWSAAFGCMLGVAIGFGMVLYGVLSSILY